jgi:hypothetical protein
VQRIAQAPAGVAATWLEGLVCGGGNDEPMLLVCRLD